MHIYLSRYPHDDDAPPEEPPRLFAQAPTPLDPKVHTWSKEWDGLNHVLWEAGALTLLALLVQECKC